MISRSLAVVLAVLAVSAAAAADVEVAPEAGGAAAFNAAAASVAPAPIAFVASPLAPSLLSAVPSASAAPVLQAAPSAAEPASVPPRAASFLASASPSVIGPPAAPEGSASSLSRLTSASREPASTASSRGVESSAGASAESDAMGQSVRFDLRAPGSPADVPTSAASTLESAPGSFHALASAARPSEKGAPRAAAAADASSGAEERAASLSQFAIEGLLAQLGYGRLSSALGLTRMIGSRIPALTSSMGGLWAWARPDAAQGARAGIAGALAANLSRASLRQQYLMARAMNQNPELKEAFWRPLEAYVLNGEKSSPIVSLPEFPEWFGKQESSLKDRMPTLWSVMQSPAGISRLLSVMSFLRMAYGPKAEIASMPIASAREQGIEFNLGETRITPPTDSFRRMVFHVDEGLGSFAVEMKMPGDLPERKLLEPITMTVANEILARDPDALIVKPVFLGEWSGSVRMFGKRLNYSKDKPLVVMFFDYQDGKRYQRSTQMLNALAARYSLTPAETRKLKAEALADVAWTSYLSHELGWRGQGDTHTENFRIVPVLDGGRLALRGVLVDDFESYEKTPNLKSDWKQRRIETGMLLEFGMDDHGRSLREEIYAALERRMPAKIPDPRRAAVVLEELRRELDLDRPSKGG